MARIAAEARDSQQVGNSRPSEDMTPPDQMRDSVDREAHQQGMADDHAGAMAHNDRLKEALDDWYAAELERKGMEADGQGNEQEYQRGNDY